MILNDDIVKKAGLTQQQINYQVGQVRLDIRHRSLLYHGDRRPLAISGRTVIIVDDGLASGYTMRAAIESLRHRNPEKIVAAVPVAPEHIAEEMCHVADSVVACAIGTEKIFYLSDYYRFWQDTTDTEVLQCLKEWRMRHYRPEIQIPDKKQNRF
jgi:predicted phosphoribosyltransferase